MNKVVKWMMVVMLVSIDILTPFGNAELYDENVVSQINDEIEQEIEISVQEENQQYADEDLQSEEDEDEEEIGEEQIVTVIDEGITGGELEENDDVEKKDLMEDENLGEIGDLDNDLQEEEDKNMTKIVKDGYKNELNGSGNGIVENVINEIAENFMEEINIFDNNKLVESPFNPIEITGSRTIDEVTVNVLAPIGSFYSGTELVIQPVKTKVLNEIKNQLVEEQDEITEDSTVIAFDISFIYSGEEVQPLSGTVQVSFNYETNDELKQAVEDEGKEVQVYHINDKDEEGNITENKEIEKIDIVESSEGEVIVEAESFSIYTIVTQVAEEGPKAEAENQLANFVYGEISIARPDSLSETDYPIEGFTIMDRNLGAITTGAGASAPVESYGYHYQWGNNYGFNSNIDPSELITSSVKVNVSGLTEYNSGTFIISNITNDTNARTDTWMESNNNNLWNGDKIQGPCPEGWHIPSVDELNHLLIYWAKSNNIGWTLNSNLVKLNGGHSKVSNDLYIPYAGARNYDASFLNRGNLGIFWSYSINGSNKLPYDFFTTNKNNPNETYIRNSDGRIRGISVRCFKDEYSGTGDIITITYDFNGGSGSVVNQMVKSGSFAEKPTDPIKSGYIFNGWYISGTDMLYDFTQTVVEDIELYAKYICEDGKVNNGIQCIEKHGSSTLKQGDSFNNTLLSLTGVEDIIVIKKTDVAPSDEILITGNLARSGLPVIARYENVGGTGTIYYYSEALDIYMYSNSNGMFKNLSYLTELDIRDFNTTNVTTMGSMFYGCSSLLKLDVSNFNTSKVTSIADMFRGCSSLMYLDLSNFDTSKVTSMQSTFMGCSNLESLNISTFDTSSLKNISWTFDGCKNLRYLDLTSFDTTNITTMQRSFKGCNNLKIIYASEKFIATGSLTETFLNTTGVVGGNGTISSNKSGKYAHIDTEDNPGYFTDPNNFTVRFLSGDEIVTNLTGRVGEVAPTIQGDGRIYSYYSDSQKTIPYDFEQTLSGYTEIYVDWVEKTAYLKNGSDFRATLKGLAGGSLSNVLIITGTNSIPEGVETGLLSLSTSEMPVVAWFDDGVIYYYSEADVIMVNPDASWMFAQFPNLTTINIERFNTSDVTNMFAIFYEDKKLESLELSNFNTSNVKNMEYMFAGCKGLTGLNLSNFNTSNVEKMDHMFDGCSLLVDLDITSFNTNKVTDMSNMFLNDSSLTGLDLSNFETNNVITMSSMFEGCSKLETLNLRGFNTNKVTSMKNMFFKCYNLKNIDVSSFDTSNVTDMFAMFYQNNKLDTIDVSNFNTSNVKNMEYMFAGCKGLTGLNLSNFNTSNVEKMDHMFDGCSLLVDLDITSFNTNKVTDMSSMFLNDSSLTGLDLSNFETNNVITMSSMFEGCNNLKSINLSSFNTNSVKSMRSMFNGCNNLLSLNLSNFDTSNVTDMFAMFYQNNKLETLNLSSFNTSNVTTMEHMFNGCNSLIELDISNFDTSNVKNMSAMFLNCYNIKGLNLNNFDTTNVTNMASMFDGCVKLETIELENFDTSNVTTMNSMFRLCYKLTNLNVSNFDTSNVSDMYAIFHKCENLKSLNLTNWNTSNLKNISHAFSNMTNLKTVYVSGNFETGSITTSNELFSNSTNLLGGNGTKYNSSFKDITYAKIDNEYQSGYFTDPNNFTVKYLSGTEIVANLTGKIGETATGLNDEGRIYSYYSDVSKTIPYDFTTLLSGYTEIYVDWIYENEDVTIETNNSEYGTVNDGDITVEYGSTITTSGNELMIDGNTIIATPNASNNQYTYGFNGWANTCGSETNPTYFDEIIYKYEGDYKFDGSNYINTNVSLFSDENYQRDFEISFDIVNYNTNTESQGSFISVMNETGNPYPGIVFRRSSKNAITLELVSNGGVGTSIHEYNSSNVQNVKISRKNSKLYLQINGGENTEVYDYTNFNSFFNVPLTIGASLDGNGNPWRYIKATLSNIEVKFTDGIGVTNGETVTGDCTITANFSRVKNSYPVTFKNYDGTILNEKTMEYGTTSQYVGDIPSKQGNVQYNYRFAGWDHQISQVIESQLYTATYTTELNQYTATIVSNNINSGTVNLGSVKADYNKSIVLSGNTVKIGETTVIATPKNSNEQYTYEFSGWNNMCGDLLAGDCTITAEFNSTVNKYLITFIDGDGNVIQSGMVEYGTIPVYLGNEPTKTKTAQYTYSFSGWDLELEEVMGQKTYTATFTQTLNKYNIIFVDEDGETVLGSGMYVYGTQSGDIVRPIAQKPATAEYTYTFAGWTPEIQEVTTGATYRATYSLTKNKYTIVWLDGDGNILKSEQIEYGKNPVYSGVVPTKTATQQYTYIFNNTWTPNIESVTTGAEYMAQFDSSINSYAVIINALPTGYGTVSSGSVVVNYGTTINVNSNVLLIGSETITATPIENDAQYTYIFSGWNNTCGNILQDNCTITAEFNRTVNEYIIKWEDGDGNIIWSGMYEYGVLPEYSGPTPTKVSTDEYNYTFNGQWLPSIHIVTGDAEYLAQFDGEIIRKGSRNEQSGAGRRKKDISDIEIHLSAEENSSTGNVDVLDKPYKSEDDSYGSNTNISKDSSSQILGGQTEFEQAYNFAKLNGITTTPSIQKAKMNTNITRIQMAKMLSYYAINVLGKIPDTERGIIKFNDVTNKMDKQYDNGVTLAYQLGIMGINMKNNSFRPNDEVTRAEFATALSRMLYDVEDGKGKIKYYEPHMAKLYNEGIITNTNPKLKEKRGYVMIMLMRSIKNTAK